MLRYEEVFSERKGLFFSENIEETKTTLYLR